MKRVCTKCEGGGFADKGMYKWIVFSKYIMCFVFFCELMSFVFMGNEETASPQKLVVGIFFILPHKDSSRDQIVPHTKSIRSE
jgi:hypothetical protein